MKKLHVRKGGFTLIELMIVVAIIGILAAIAIPNFLRFQLKAKTSEGKTNIAAIRTAEQSYYSEFGGYVSSAGDTQAGAVPGAVKDVFDDSTATGFDTIGWSPEGQVYFMYSVATPSATDLTGMIITADADIDANGTWQSWGYHKPGIGGDVSPAGASVCVTADLLGIAGNDQVGPCDVTYGQSEF
jgi:type IV pilus assembly protein PilA